MESEGPALPVNADSAAVCPSWCTTVAGCCGGSRSKSSPTPAVPACSVDAGATGLPNGRAPVPST
jgi:hypothetical protein